MYPIQYKKCLDSFDKNVTQYNANLRKEISNLLCDSLIFQCRIVDKSSCEEDTQKIVQQWSELASFYDSGYSRAHQLSQEEPSCKKEARELYELREIARDITQMYSPPNL